MSEAEGVGEAIVQVADDAKAYAAAKIGVYKAIAGTRWRLARSGLILGTIAAVLAFSALIALSVGLILSLMPALGPFGATAAVVVGTLVITAVLGWLAAKRLGAAFGELG